MTPEVLAEQELKRLAAIHLANARVLLFGSRATGRAGPRSDFDLAVEPREGFRDWQLSMFREAVEEDSAIIYRVDVVNLADVDEAWRRKIESEGKPWKS
jgi:predicted nucleotidyltransferase